MTAVIEVPELPRLGPLYRRAVLATARRRPAGDRLPETAFLVRDVGVDREHLAYYDRVCGFRLSDAVPATYPHVLAFPLTVALMTRPDFPFAMIGLVQVANAIGVHRPLTADDRYTLRVHTEDLRAHPRGRQLDVVAEALVGEEAVWTGRSTYLYREGGTDGARRAVDAPATPADDAPAPVGAALWPVTRRVGIDYAEVSGDRNPIHTSRVGARLFGFRRPIAHGMWSTARALAALEGRLPARYDVDVRFRRPIPLPSTVAFTASPAEDAGWHFAVHGSRPGRPHLDGAVIHKR